MKQGGTPLGLCALLAGLLASAAGCLPDDPKVKGRLLVAGSNIARPRFVAIDNEPWILYEERVARAGANHGGIVDLLLVKWADANQNRLLLGGRVERPEWRVDIDDSGARFYVTNERLTPGALPYGNLHRVTYSEGIRETLPDVMTYALGPTKRTFYYRKYVAGERLAELHLHHIDGRDRNLGPVAPGQIVLAKEDTMYFIVGDNRVLTRTVGFDGVAEPLRTHVSQFQLGPGQKFGLLTVTDDGKPRSLVHDFATKTETPLPVDTPCCWLGIGETTVEFAESAKEGVPAVLHSFDFTTSEDRKLVMPAGLHDVVLRVHRDQTDEVLFFDTRGNMALYRPKGEPTLRLLSLRPRRYEFSKDGKYFFYMLADPPPPPPAVASFSSGQLFVQNADDWDEPPRLLSPKGASVPLEPDKGYYIREEKPYPLVFWAHYGLGASDLYLGDHENGTSLLVARGIGQVAVSQSEVLGVMNIGQDLTGELVFRDFHANKQTVIERGIYEVEYREGGREIVFSVRERMPSSPRNGLWATTLPTFEELADGAARSVTNFAPTFDLSFRDIDAGAVQQRSER